MNVKIVVSTLCMFGLVACGGSGSEMEVPPPPPPAADIPDPPTISANTVAARRTAYTTANNLPIPPSPVVGNASYSGAIITGVSGADGVTGMTGNLALRTGFANGSLTGGVTNIHLLDGGNTPSESVRGSLTVAGSAGGITKDVDATMRGTLNGVFGDDTRGDVVINGNLDGRIRGPNIFNPGASMTGQVSGTGTGSETININGTFYANQ